VIVIDARTGATIANVRRGASSQLAGEIDFEPVSGPGRYFVYYLPYLSGGRSNYPNVAYLPVRNTADSGWLARVATTPPATATVLRFEAVDSLNAVFPMEVVATAEEAAALVVRHPGHPLLVFPEDRRHPIAMFDQLPKRWIDAGPGGTLQLSAGGANSSPFNSASTPIWSGIQLLAARIALAAGDLEGAALMLPHTVPAGQGYLEPLADDLRGRIHFALGRPDSALKPWHRARTRFTWGFELADEWERIPLSIAHAALAIGDSAAARTALAEILAQWQDAPQDFPDRRLARDLFRRLQRDGTPPTFPSPPKRPAVRRGSASPIRDRPGPAIGLGHGRAGGPGPRGTE
jgi:hypothetical protein